MLRLQRLCSKSSQLGLVAMRRFTQLLKQRPTKRQVDALSAAFQADRWWV